MARSRETKIELTAYDDLFQTDESREEAKLSKIRDIPISEIDEFPDHPFKVLMDEDMEQLVESIKRNGVMTPATVRLKEDGRYELISGHRRKKACELAGLETLKCEVKELTRDEAIIVMVESNLQRSVILPSEKAFAYKMRLEKQLDDIERGIDDVQASKGEQFTVKQLMKTRKAIKTKLEKLNDTKRKDTVIDFEQLGVDRLFIDESHFYKNLYLYTKMRNVGGIAQTEAQKSSDLFMKCRYLDEITGNRGTVFATGTPVSNSMVELYSVQRYLQYDTLAQNGLQHFDSWASTFGETVTALELAPEGYTLVGR